MSGSPGDRSRAGHLRHPLRWTCLRRPSHLMRSSLVPLAACFAWFGVWSGEGVAEMRAEAETGAVAEMRAGEGALKGSSIVVAPASDSLPTLAEMRSWTSTEWESGPAAEAILRIMEARPPTEATRWIHLLTVLDRVGPLAAPAAFEAVARADEGETDDAVKAVLEVVESLEHADQGPLLALAALLGETGDPTGAAELRSRVIAEHPDELEVPELRLRHARWLLSINARRDEGFGFLEDLIVDHPEHPIAPEARRLLQLERARQSALE